MDHNDAGPSEYASIPTPTRIKMKETKPEKAHRLYRREQRRVAREQERISRANGYAVSPPRPTRSESISPPRHAPKQQIPIYEDDDQGEWMGGYGRRAKEELDKREWAEKVAWMAQDDFQYGSFVAAADLAEEAVHIPHRHRKAARGDVGSSSALPTSKRGRDAAAEVEFAGGPVPPLGSMSESEYSEFIRMGMYRRKHRAEVEEAEKRRRAKEEKERLKEAEREKAKKEETRRIKRLKAEAGAEEERRKKDERKRWGERWKSLVDVGGEVEASELRFDDIPWPIHRSTLTSSTSSKSRTTITIDDLTINDIRSFLHALAEDQGGDTRKVVREAIRTFHPDRFHGRILPRVREKDQVMVKEGIEGVSRILNDLAAEGK